MVKKLAVMAKNIIYLFYTKKKYIKIKIYKF